MTSETQSDAARIAHVSPPDLQRIGRIRQRVRRLANDAAKFARFGPGYPRAFEALTVETSRIRQAIVHPLEAGCAPSDPRYAALERSFAAARAARTRVVDPSLMRHLVPVDLDTLVKMRCCIAHWRDGQTWEQTGIFDLMMAKIAHSGRPQSGCRTIADVRARYARLDRIFETVRRGGALRGADGSQRHGGRAVPDGIEIHIAADGAPIFGNRGHHRLAMARVLGLPRIPAMLGFVHEQAVTHLPGYRWPPVPGPSRTPEHSAAI